MVEHSTTPRRSTEISLAYRTLFQNTVHLLLSVAGVALSVMLISALSGFASVVYSRHSLSGKR